MLSNYVEHTKEKEEEEEKAHHEIQKCSVDLWRRLTCLGTLFEKEKKKKFC